jgi:arabinofuranan 3-O-arabinosyltransferase
MQCGLLVEDTCASTAQRESGMADTAPDLMTPPERGAIPPALFNACFVLLTVNAVFFPVAWFSHWWIRDAAGLGYPTDFVNVWSAGKLALDGHPAWAWDWDVQKQVQIGVLHRSYEGNLAWHYPPPFLFIALLLATLPYLAAFIGWACASFIPYLVVMRAIVGRPFGLLLAGAFPVVLNNALVGQNGFLTAALIGGTLYLIPVRPVLAGICLGLLSYKPQYGILFPIVLIAAGQWRVFVSAAVTAVTLAAVSWLAFGAESWQAFFHWMPVFSQAFLVDGRAPWGKMQSIFALVRYFGGPEQLAWSLQLVLSTAVAVTLALIWRSRVTYSLKAAALAAGILLVTPYLFLYDVMVLAIAVAFLVRIGLRHGFERHEFPALALVVALLISYSFVGAPTGFAATLIVSGLILHRCWPKRSVEPSKHRLRDDELIRI